MKYKIRTDLSTEFNGIKLFRIELLVETSFGKPGDIGGYVEKESNLSQLADNAWISENAWVYGNAFVTGDAHVSGDAWVYGNARVSGNAQVSGDAEVYGHALVCGNKLVENVKSGGSK